MFNAKMTMQVDFRDSLQINTGEEYITHSQRGRKPPQVGWQL